LHLLYLQKFLAQLPAPSDQIKGNARFHIIIDP